MHKEELHDSHFSPNILRMMKSGRTKWPIHATRKKGEKKFVQRFDMDLEGNNYLENL